MLGTLRCFQGYYGRGRNRACRHYSSSPKQRQSNIAVFLFGHKFLNFPTVFIRTFNFEPLKRWQGEMALKVGSIVSNIVQKASAYDREVIDESIERLVKKSGHLRGELYELVKQNYLAFDSYLSTTVALEQRVQEVRDEYQKISSRIEHDLSHRIALTFDKKEEIESKLKETQSRIDLIQHLVDIYQAVETGRSHVQSGKYKLAGEQLSNASDSLSGLGKGGCDALVFRALKSEQATVLCDLTLQLEEEWQKFVTWSPKVVPSEPNLEVLSSVKLHILVLSSIQEDHMKDVVSAMKYLLVLGVWEKRARIFAHKILKLIIKPLVVHQSLRIHQSSSKGQIIVSMSKSETEVTSIMELYDLLLYVFKVIGRVVVQEYKGEWLKMVGGIVCPEVEEMMIAHRLSTSIPRTLLELQDYESIREKTKEFEAAVEALGLVEGGTMHKMSEYANDINAHFVMQKSQDMLVKARTILMQPIHDTIIITSVEPILKLKQIFSTTALADDSSSGCADEAYGSDISSLSFKFPHCSVSKSVQDYVNYLYLTLKECVDSTNAASGLQLFHVARNMVDLFCAVLPSYHSSAISELPRVAAVQHNNCMYLAHHLITLGHQFYSRLPPPLNQQSSTFVDYIPIVRQLGDECFSAEMRKQSACILKYLKSFGTFIKVSCDDQREIVWQAMQAAISHISKLSKIYHGILPAHMHSEAVGKLLDTCMTEVIRMVLFMEDITAADATELHALLNMIVNQASQVLLLTQKGESDLVHKFCKSWKKLRSLSLVLNASLLDITYMWDSGKGYLATEFSVGEVRALIKAIFRNTERRAAALNKITLS